MKKTVSKLLAAVMLSGVFSGFAGAEAAELPAGNIWVNTFSDSTYNPTTNDKYNDKNAVGSFAPMAGQTNKLTERDDGYAVNVKNTITTSGSANFYVCPVYSAVEYNHETPSVFYYSMEFSPNEKLTNKTFNIRLRRTKDEAPSTDWIKVLEFNTSGNIAVALGKNKETMQYSVETYYYVDFILDRISGQYAIYVNGEKLSEGTSAEFTLSEDGYTKSELIKNGEQGVEIGAWTNKQVTIDYSVDNLCFALYDTDVFSALSDYCTQEHKKDKPDEPTEPIAEFSYTNAFAYSDYSDIANAKDKTFGSANSHVGYTTANARILANVGSKGDDDFAMELTTDERANASWTVSPNYSEVSGTDSNNVLYFSAELGSFDPWATASDAPGKRILIQQLKKGTQTIQIAKNAVKLCPDNYVRTDFDSSVKIPYKAYTMYRFDIVLDRINGTYSLYMDGEKISSGVCNDFIYDSSYTTYMANGKGIDICFWNPTAGKKGKMVIDNVKYELYKNSGFDAVDKMVAAGIGEREIQPIENDFSASVGDSTSWNNSYGVFKFFKDAGNQGQNGNAVTTARLESGIGGRVAADSSLFVTSPAGSGYNKIAATPNLIYNIDAVDSDANTYNSFTYSAGDNIKFGISFMLPKDIKAYKALNIAVRYRRNNDSIIDRDTISFDFENGLMAKSLDVGKFVPGKWYRYEVIARNGADEDKTYVDYYLDGIKLNEISSELTGRMYSVRDIRIIPEIDAAYSEDGTTFDIEQTQGIYFDDFTFCPPRSEEYKAITMPVFTNAASQAVCGYYTTADNTTVADVISALENRELYKSPTAMDSDYDSISDDSAAPAIGKYIKLTEDGIPLFITFEKQLRVLGFAEENGVSTLTTEGMDTAAAIIIASYNGDGTLASAELADYDVRNNGIYSAATTGSTAKAFVWHMSSLSPVAAQ